jgi:hypothetical protein
LHPELMLTSVPMLCQWGETPTAANRIEF